MTKCILFFAEAVTLAHVARPLALAAALRPQHQVTIAVDSRYRQFVDRSGRRAVPLHSLGSAAFMQRLSRGAPVYMFEELRRYVRDDLGLIEQMQPDLVIGDFRLSLSVSARLAGVRYATLANAYWSPYILDRSYPLPVLPFTRYVPLPAARSVFAMFAPAVMRLHCLPMNRLRRENGLPSLGTDLRRIYTDADHTLYTDAPGMFPMRELPPGHSMIGPALWSPPVALPPWWNELPAHGRIVYATLGSSGPKPLLGTVLSVLASLDVTVVAATAGAPVPPGLPPNVRVADYLPGDAAARRASLVVCNGGSPTTQQALAAGVPVLGITSNMDQFLNMRGVERAGAGLSMRADRLNPDALRRTALELLNVSQARAAATVLASDFERCRAADRFAAFVDATIGSA